MEDLDLWYLFAAQYLARYEIGLAPHRDELSAIEEDVILFVSSERARQAGEKRKGSGPETEDDHDWRDDAEPTEVEVSDNDLIKQAAVRQQRR